MVYSKKDSKSKDSKSVKAPAKADTAKPSEKSADKVISTKVTAVGQKTETVPAAAPAWDKNKQGVTAGMTVPSGMTVPAAERASDTTKQVVADAKADVTPPAARAWDKTKQVVADAKADVTPPAERVWDKTKDVGEDAKDKVVEKIEDLRK